jgi:heme/copper-type cytochrome/quinol oxidase subunit 1
MNSLIFLLGFLIVIGTFVVANIIITPEQRNQIEIVNQMCGFNLFGVPLGKIGQAVNPEIAQQYQQIGILGKFFSVTPYLYAVGFVLIIVGLVLGQKTKEVVKVKEKPVSVSKEEPEEVEEEEDTEPETKKASKKAKFCIECGNKLKPEDKFCGKCGTEV